MVPTAYVVIYTEEKRRIFVVFSQVYGDFVLTKECKNIGCKCMGCVLGQATIHTCEEEIPVLDLESQKELEDNMVVIPFTEEGEMFLKGLKIERYRRYRGRLNRAMLEDVCQTPDAVLLIKAEDDGTYTHSYASLSLDQRVIARGCIAKNCPCIGCRIQDMHYIEASGKLVKMIDQNKGGVNSSGEIVLPIFQGEAILSKLLGRDPSIRHDYKPYPFGSPIEEMFFELAFLDLHIFPQYQAGRYRLDFAIPNKRIAIELDGHEYHKTKYQRTHDAQRDRWLFGEGWNVLRFTGSEIYKDLNGCIDEICKLAKVERLSAQSAIPL
ncbi:endonuclease domain-containing protein [Pseudomonas mandelii]|uniref:endonuclease domain-containing protein n=1 Tax=Pseudomonas mandelii TaxID=75612 RepID=UPI001375A6D7|nr:DUF559 domain-containing protein [Pseudomonas mandelii]